MKLSAFVAGVGLLLLILSVMPWPVGGGAEPQIAIANIDQAAYGRALFSVKGCVQCHIHRDIAGSGKFFGGYGAQDAPVLSSYKPVPDYLRLWLKDPKSVKANTTMPNLELSQAEIEALIAFLVKSNSS